MSNFVFFALLYLLSSETLFPVFSQVPRRKPFILKQISISTLAGIEPKQVQTGQLASQIVLDNINNRSDILPDYHLEIDLREDFMGFRAAMQLVDFRRSWDPSIPGTYQSPISIGPLISTGCKTIGPVLPHMYSVGLATFCSAPLFADHSLYPNMYLSLTTGITTAISMLHFMRNVGNWNRFAILAQSTSIYDYSMALFLHDKAVANGFEVPWFNTFVDVNMDVILDLKASGVRIIVLALVTAPLVARFLCDAFQAGLSGPRFVFLLLNSQFSVTPSSNCTVGMLVQQWRQSYLFGPILKPLNYSLVSDLGYNAAQFEAEMSRRMNMTVENFLAGFTLHDVSLRVVMVLDRTERRLKQNYNLSLRDYHQYPELVARVANQTMLETKVHGVRIGPMWYGSKGQVQGEVDSVANWSPATGLRNLALVRQFPSASSDEFDYNRYGLQQIAQVNWIGGKRPLDRPLVIRTILQVPPTSFGVCWFVIVVVSVLQIVGLVAVAVDKVLKTNYRASKVLGLVGCLILNAASGAFIFNRQAHQPALPIVSLALMCLGSSIVFGTWSMRLAVIKAYIKRKRERKTMTGRSKANIVKNKASSSKSTSSPGSRLRSCLSSGAPSNHIESGGKLVVSFPTNWKQFDVKTFAATLTFSAIVFAILIGWLASQDMACLNKLAGEPIYSESKDTFDEAWHVQCAMSEAYSPIGWSLLGTIAGLEMIVLLLGLLLAFQLKQIKGVAANCKEFLPSCLGLIVSGTLLPAGLLIAIITGNDSIQQQVAIAFMLVSISALTSIPFIYPSFYKPKPEPVSTLRQVAPHVH